MSFALLEDRKFKTSPDGSPGLPVADWDLLGSRQEAMLASLAGGTKPVVVLTQTIWASVLTNTVGAITGTKDTGGFPKPARDRALDLVKAARGVLLCGDSHLATLVRHGTTSAQGPVQFGGPAVGSSYTRWFQPAEPLPDPNGQPWTGQARDALGNDFRVLAVANPRITSEESFTRGGDPNIGDRTLRQEGYGVLVVDKVRRTYRFESWENGVDPAAPGAMQMPGWPYTMSFDDA